MSSEFAYLEEEGIVLIRTSGPYELGKEQKSIEAVVSRLREHNCNKCLIDLRASRLVASSMTYHDRPAVYMDLGVERSVRIAIVVGEITDDIAFYENTCRNRGWNIKIFTEYDAALRSLAIGGHAV